MDLTVSGTRASRGTTWQSDNGDLPPYGDSYPHVGSLGTLRTSRPSKCRGRFPAAGAAESVDRTNVPKDLD